MAKVELKNLVKTYNATTTVLQGLNVEVPDGSFMVMVGPSGCGKSTALRCVAGLEEVTSGQIFIGNDDVTAKEPKDRNIAMVFQNYALYPHMNVLDNITYGLKVRGMKKEERVKRAQEAATLLNLDGLLERMPRQLSGGQRQRVAMGRALVREPSVFLFDEPLSNLDANLRNQMRIELRKLHSRLGTTSIYVTHDQVEAMTLADRILVMRAGHIEQYGTPDEIYMKPASVFVAKFMGFPAMNTIPASIVEGKIVLSDGSVLANALPKGSQVPANSEEILLGIRSEDLIPDPNGPITLLVDIIETLGPDTLVHCFVKIAGINRQYAYLSNKSIPVVVRFEGSIRPSSGEVLRLSVRPGHGHLFDAKTKLRIA